jgi:geranylgeranyl pyrophosphate synthase
VVLDRAEAFARAHAASSEQAAGLAVAIRAYRAGLADLALVGSVQTVLQVYSGVRGNDDAAIPLAVAVALLEAGIHTLDDVADGDTGEIWTGYTPAEISLFGTGLIGAVAPLAVASLSTSAQTRTDLSRILARGLITTGAGQQVDLRLQQSTEVTLDAIEEADLMKSGERRATWAAMAARLADAPPEASQAYVEMARATGTAAQISSDCRELLVDQDSRDLVRGTRTFPIALFLGNQHGSARQEFLDLLDLARVSAEARGKVRQRLSEAGVHHLSGMIVEKYCRRARAALAAAAPSEPSATLLKGLIASVSFAVRNPR